MPTDISWSEVVVNVASVVRTLDGTQTMAGFAQTATASSAAAGTHDIAWLSVGVPNAAAATRDLSATQTMGDFVQDASMFDIIGQINGGGTIGNELPHKSLTATQTMGDLGQSAAAGALGTLGQIQLSANQAMGDFVQGFSADASRTISVTQLMADFVQSARIGDPPSTNVVTGGYGQQRSNKYRTRVGNKTISAATYQDLRERVLALDAQEEMDISTKPARVTRVGVLPVDPMEAVRAEMRAATQAQIAEMQAQMMLAIQSTQQSAKQLEQVLSERVANAEQSATSAILIAQRAQRDNDALTALLSQ
jgi:hypothetical protein